MYGPVHRLLLCTATAAVLVIGHAVDGRAVDAAPETGAPTDATTPGPEPTNAARAVDAPALPIPDVTTLTGSDLIHAPLASGLTEQEAAIAAELRRLVATDLARHIDRKSDRDAIEIFYRDRGFAPLWIARGAPAARAEQAMAFLRGVDADGLDPDDYPTPHLTRGRDAAALANDELQLTDSLLTFARHARTGRVSFTRVSGAMSYDLQFPDPADVLAALAASSNIRETLDSYNPQHPAYQALKAKLAELRSQIDRDEMPVRMPEGPILRPGTEDMRVPILRRRLGVPGDGSSRYDEELVAAVEAFQRNEGLIPDSLVGPRTIARLNRDNPSDVIDTIRANMERWRWLPRDLGRAHVIVNVPDYTLEVFDGGKSVWSTRVVVGKPGRLATPLISDSIEYITVNPTWNVPPSIIRNEYLPVLQSDPGALSRIGLKVAYNRDGSIRLYQPPGEGNALGRLRFNFPNKFLIFQHDTPSKHLFAKEARAYSHGCIRVQYPDEYAEVLLSLSQPDDGYTAERIRRLFGKGERTITFTNPIPVHMTYQTAFVDGEGNLQVRKDIYGHDAAIRDLLRGSDRRVADRPIKRRVASSSKPVRVRLPSYHARHSPRYERDFYVDHRPRPRSRFAGPDLFDFLFR